MKGIVLCNKGIEDIAALDVKEIIGKTAKVFDGYIIFSIDSYKDLCQLCYWSQSIRKVLLLLGSFKKIKSIEINQKWLAPDKTFKVAGNISDEEKGEIGALINPQKRKVDLENPDVTIYVYKNKEYYVGIDFSGKDLSKRNYRIFSNAKNIKSTIAYAMVRLSGFKQGESLIDPFCLSGSIPIEASLFKNKSIHFYEKDFLFSKFMEFEFEEAKSKDKSKIYAIDSQFRNVDAAKKNAKIAGIHKNINFSRLEINWLDTKFGKESVDRIVTCLPIISKYSNRKEILKIYKEFFHQAEFVLKGSIVICTKNPKEVKEAASKFKVKEQREVWQGKEKLNLIKFNKNK